MSSRCFLPSQVSQAEAWHFGEKQLEFHAPTWIWQKLTLEGKTLKAWVWSLFKSVLLNTFIPRLSTLVYIVFASVWSQLSIICIQLYIVIIYLLHKQEFPFMVFCFYESMAISNIAICDVRHSSPMYTVLLKWEKILQYHMGRSHHYCYWPYIYVLLENIITNNSGHYSSSHKVQP